jgi:undecaprenyl-diphosphatase
MAGVGGQSLVDVAIDGKCDDRAENHHQADSGRVPSLSHRRGQIVVEADTNSYRPLCEKSAAQSLPRRKTNAMACNLSEGIDALTAAALGALQGLTEFLPVSSSGHVAIGARFFDIRESSLALVILLHLGTLLATVILFRRDIALLAAEAMAALRDPTRLRTTVEGRALVGIAIVTLITAVIGLLLRSVAEAFAEDLHLVGYGFLVSAAFLLASAFAAGASEEVSWRQAAGIGLAQGVAVLPGVSRSGVTIAVAMLLGVQSNAAFRFSFLVSLPAIAGAAAYEASGAEGLGSLGPEAWVGGLTALVTGYVALVILQRIILVGRMWTFAIYLLPLGLFLVTR